jgi:hypothetical protein
MLFILSVIAALITILIGWYINRFASYVFTLQDLEEIELAGWYRGEIVRKFARWFRRLELKHLHGVMRAKGF